MSRGAIRASPTACVVRTRTSAVELVFFHAKAEYLARTLPVGTKRIVSGRIERFGGRLQIVHPDYIVSPEQADQLPRTNPFIA